MLAMLASMTLNAPVGAEQLDVWLGTSTPPAGRSRGIYHATLNDRTGALSKARLVAEVAEPGFLALHPSLPVLYAAATVDGAPSVVAYRIAGSGEQANLQKIGAQPIGDGGAAHLSVDRTGKVLMTAQYGGGSVAVFPLSGDGAVGPRSQLIEHEGGSGVVADRQDAPHPHMARVSPDNRFLLVPDLGADRVYIYQLDPNKAQLTPSGAVQTPPGGGPRHLAFHPNGKWAYLVNELAMTLSLLDCDWDAGKLSVKQTAPTLSPEQIAGERFNSGSDVCVHPSGKYVYSANRGHDTITAFKADPSSGALSLIGQVPVRGAHPRNFNLDPSGRWLLAAGRDSNTLAVFAIDPSTGALQFTGTVADVPGPICVVFGADRAAP
ncbi:6-phosphogluconolactonase [Pirellulimonas nuda]|uniref:6-phosphogluconolactonase n=1 Tax=Pirellulimonas nuda TaxID=2528009 RepID=A0A518DGW9_9BACT|nr:lactonase family protein [Pirellulimonas nuda]QDU90682.1 6-phosphogluconolactonase [Pirellulimonas nuda]